MFDEVSVKFDPDIRSFFSDFYHLELTDQQLRSSSSSRQEPSAPGARSNPKAKHSGIFYAFPSALSNVYDILTGYIHETHPMALVDGELDPFRGRTVFD